MEYGKRFRLYRDKKGLTQKEAAEALGITPYQLGNYETDRSEPNIATLKKMSQLYQVSLDRLLGNRFAPMQSIEENEPKFDIDEIKAALDDFCNRYRKEQN
ncbi:MAG: helix-turn-helix transcriptional regulator [Bacilli bacterium]|nr:helix-turn-helix transcriptional regulator [Bacilli bacterium]